MSYINLMEQLTLAEQEETVKLLCNMCSNPGSFDWLMYISEVCNIMLYIASVSIEYNKTSTTYPNYYKT